MKKIWVLCVENEDTGDCYECIHSVHNELPSIELLMKVTDLDEVSARELLYTNSAYYDDSSYVFRSVNFHD